MKQNVLILSLLLLCLGLYTLYEGREAIWTQQETADSAAPILQDTPDFQFTSLLGKNYSLSDFKGKVIVLNFWASWCAPCLVEFPQMLNLAQMKKDKSVFLFVSVDDNKDNMNRFLKKMGAAMDQKNVFVAHDPEKKISQTLFQTYRLPETFLINSDFRIQEKIIGASVIWDDVSMQEKIDSLYTK